MVDFAKGCCPSEAEVEAVLQSAANGLQSASTLLSAIAPERQAWVFRALAWLAKLGVLNVCP